MAHQVKVTFAQLQIRNFQGYQMRQNRLRNRHSPHTRYSPAEAKKSQYQEDNPQIKPRKNGTSLT